MWTEFFALYNERQRFFEALININYAISIIADEQQTKDINNYFQNKNLLICHA